MNAAITKICGYKEKYQFEKRQKLYQRIKKTKVFNDAKTEIKRKYDAGFGFKRLAKEYGITYSKMRWLLIDLMQIKHRKGRSVVTDELKKIRSANVQGEKNPWFEWPKRKPELQKQNRRGIQGYYWNKSKSKYVWLRSTAEYIYAKWLNSKNIEWDTEVKYYTTTDGIKYLPDFFIYDSAGRLKSIVEIKPTKFYDRGKRIDELVVIDDINQYIASGLNYKKETETWRLLRKLK